MKHIIVITPIKHLHNVYQELEKLGKIYYHPYISKTELSIFLKENQQIEYLFTNPNKQGFKLNKEILDTANIKVINTASTGLNHIDLVYCENNNIKVWSLTKDYELINDLPSTSELGFGLMINLLRKIPQSFESVKQYEWNYEPFVGRQIKGLTIGIIGFGRLGKIMANFCYHFGMKVLIYDPYVSIENINKNYVKVNLEELKECDIISLHVHVTGGTKYMINKDFIKNMKPFYLINTSRGEIVNEDAIIEGLKEGNILGYGTDVLESEFHSIENNNLIKMAKENYNITITPHIGGMSIEGQNKAYMWATKKFNRT